MIKPVAFEKAIGFNSFLVNLSLPVNGVVQEKCCRRDSKGSLLPLPEAAASAKSWQQWARQSLINSSERSSMSEMLLGVWVLPQSSGEIFNGVTRYIVFSSSFLLPGLGIRHRGLSAFLWSLHGSMDYHFCRQKHRLVKAKISHKSA